jgi:hypothetical protein
VGLFLVAEFVEEVASDGVQQVVSAERVGNRVDLD